MQTTKLPQFLVAFYATIVVFATGCHTGWPTASVPKLFTDDYPFNVTSNEGSTIIVTGHLGNLFGGLLGSYLLDTIGRKTTILLIAVPQILSFTLMILTHELKELLYVARFLGGLAEGPTFTLIGLYLAEIAEPEIRGTISSLLALMAMVGMIYANLIGSYVSIPIVAGTFLIFPVLFVVLFWGTPESPYFLLMRNRTLEAEKSLKYLRGRENVTEELSHLVKDVNRQMSESGTFTDIFTIQSNRRAFFLMLGARLLQQFSGISAFSLYIQILLKQSTTTISPEIGSTLLFVVQGVVILFSTLTVDKWGRKPLLLISSGGIAVNLLLQTCYFFLRDYTNVDVSDFEWFPLLMMVCYVVIYSIGLGVVVMVISSELFSTTVKSKCVCVINVVFALAMFATTKFYQITADRYGLVVPYGCFGIATVFGFGFVAKWFPETKGKSLEEIQQFLKGRKSIKK